mmetsp:Transcript_77919/g.238404  ORF Transcript_77919/g.238404 Transcript_77919/m.238404 type:complete len:322 (+) Transcript_77919:435-1400(+)
MHGVVRCRGRRRAILVVVATDLDRVPELLDPRAVRGDLPLLLLFPRLFQQLVNRIFGVLVRRGDAEPLQALLFLVGVLARSDLVTSSTCGRESLGPFPLALLLLLRRGAAAGRRRRGGHAEGGTESFRPLRLLGILCVGAQGRGRAEPLGPLLSLVVVHLRRVDSESLGPLRLLVLLDLRRADAEALRPVEQLLPYVLLFPGGGGVRAGRSLLGGVRRLGRLGLRRRGIGVRLRAVAVTLPVRGLVLLGRVAVALGVGLGRRLRGRLQNPLHELSFCPALCKPLVLAPLLQVRDLELLELLLGRHGRARRRGWALAATSRT